MSGPMRPGHGDELSGGVRRNRLFEQDPYTGSEGAKRMLLLESSGVRRHFAGAPREAQFGTDECTAIRPLPIPVTAPALVL